MENSRIMNAELTAEAFRTEAAMGPGFVAVQAVPLMLEALYQQNLVIIELLKGKGNGET